MVEIAPLPPGFPPPAEAAPAPEPEAPTATAPLPENPLEAFGREPGPFEPVITRVLPGGGHVSATATALARLEEGQALVRRMAGPGIKHASHLAAEAREREEQAEADRRAAPDPRKVLALSHQLHAEAQAKVDRLAPLVTRARALVHDLEDRAREQAATVAGGEAAATERLVAAITAGEESLPLSPRHDAAAQALEATSVKLRTAKAALAQLEAEDKAARDLLQRRHNGISRSAFVVLTDEAIETAYEITAADEELNRRRADLNALIQLLTAEGRRLNGPASPSLPPMVSRALYSTDRTLTGADRGLVLTDWHGLYDRLRVDRGEAEAEPQQSSA